LIAVLLAVLIALVPASPAAAYDFPSDNDTNRDNGLPHVNLVAAGPNTVTLRFVNDTNSLAFFEYRIDGVEVDRGDHLVVIGDVIYPGVCVDGRAPSTRLCSPGPATRTFKVDQKVEVRLALGGERDWDFDWVTFESGTSEDDCKKGGWRDLGFRNQGQCIRFVNTGADA
jgi:hypothetical protein